MILYESDFEATTEQLPDILGWVELKSTELLPFSLALKLQLAAEEAIANVVNHGYEPDDTQRPLSLTFGDEDGIIYLEIRDSGKAFNPLEKEIPDANAPLDERTVGGWGCALIVQMTSAARYEYRDDANVLRLEENPTQAEKMTEQPE